MKRISSILIVCMLFSGILAACNLNQGAAPNPNDTRYDVARNGANMDRYGNYSRDMAPFANNNNFNGINNGFDTRLADDIAEQVTQVNGVERARVVVYGNDIVVGIEGNNNDRRKTGMNNNQNNNTANMNDNRANGVSRQLERRVQRAVQRIAPNHNIYVTSDENLVRRIQNLDGNMRGGFNNNGDMGTAARDVVADFGALVRDIGRTVTAPFR